MDAVRQIAHDVGLGIIVAVVVFGMFRFLPTDAMPTNASQHGSERAKRMSPTILAATGLVGALLLLLSYV